MKWDRKAFVVCVLVVGVCGALVWMLAARPARAFTLVPHLLVPEGYVLLEVHPNERARTARGVPALAPGDNDYDQMVAAVPMGGLWKQYTFHGHDSREAPGQYWIQVCAQTFSGEQNKAMGGASTGDSLQMVVDGSTPKDYWSIQSGPPGGPQWRGDVAKGRREVLEFHHPAPPGTGRHVIAFEARGTPIIWWIKVVKLPVQPVQTVKPVQPLTTAPTLR